MSPVKMNNFVIVYFMGFFKISFRCFVLIFSLFS